MRQLSDWCATEFGPREVAVDLAPRPFDLPWVVLDAARAIQFLRWMGESLGIDPDRIGLTGTSAGACTSMWLLLHVDLAGPHSAPFSEAVLGKLASISAEQTDLPKPALLGRVIGLPPQK